MALMCQLLHEVNSADNNQFDNNRSYKFVFTESGNQQNMGSQLQSNSEMYNLRWDSYSSNLMKVFLDHHEHEFLVDVTLSCEKKFIKVHRLVLSACSRYFSRVFELHTAPNFIILMNNVKYKFLTLIVQYMYQGEVKVADEDIQEFLALGKALEVKGLCSVELKEDTIKTAVKRKNDGDENVNECTPEKNLPFTVPYRPDVDMHKTPKKMKTLPGKIPEVIQQTPIPPIIPIPPPPVQSLKWRGDLLRMDSRLVHNPLPLVMQPTKSALKMNSSVLKPKPVQKSVPNSSNNSKKKINNKPSNVLPVGELQEDGSQKNSSHIPRPPNAFMIFANQWRKKLAVEFPNDSNKDISVKLGSMWKRLDPENKDVFYQEAEKLSREHRQKYPGYTYSPKEARERKAIAKKLSSEIQTSSDVETLDDDDVGLSIDEDSKDFVVEIDCDD